MATPRPARAKVDSPLRGVRVAHRMSLRETARRAGLDASHLMRLERGEAGLSLAALQRLARVLELRDLARLLTPYVGEQAAKEAQRKTAG
jgi:transcriptional regulator with XRE-family HTH domain